jgi:CxxC motif-containing protein (DUF1111 family)
MKQVGTLCLFIFIFILSAEAQKFTTTNAQKLVMTNEDSLQAGSKAILWHGGEAAKSKQAFTGLTQAERNQLIKFLNSL